MSLLSINKQEITAEDFVNYLKLTDQFESAFTKFVNYKLIISGGQKLGHDCSVEELQAGVDIYRRASGLHRAEDTLNWFTENKISQEQLEAFIAEQTVHTKMLEELCGDSKVESYFTLNSPKYQYVQAAHIMIDNPNAAKEIVAMLEDEPESFEELCEEHSVDEESKYKGGDMGRIRRGVLPDEIEAKLFNAKEGDIIGPIKTGDNVYEIIRCGGIAQSELNDEVSVQVMRDIEDEWLQTTGKEIPRDM